VAGDKGEKVIVPGLLQRKRRELATVKEEGRKPRGAHLVDIAILASPPPLPCTAYNCEQPPSSYTALATSGAPSDDDGVGFSRCRYAVVRDEEAHEVDEPKVDEKVDAEDKEESACEGREDGEGTSGRGEEGEEEEDREEDCEEDESGEEGREFDRGDEEEREREADTVESLELEQAG
jgi:hypothetical protein